MLVNLAGIRVIAKAVGLPLNVLAGSRIMSTAEVAAAGVRSLSVGSGIADALFGGTAAVGG